LPQRGNKPQLNGWQHANRKDSREKKRVHTRRESAGRSSSLSDPVTERGGEKRELKQNMIDVILLRGGTG